MDDDGSRAVLNIDCEVQIGQTIYKLTEDGYFGITDGNVESLKYIDEISQGRMVLPGNIIFEGDDNYTTNGKVLATGCKTSKANSSMKFGVDRKIKWKVKHATPFLVAERQVYAKTTSYKKHKNGSWKKYRTYVYAQVYGHISGLDEVCDTQVDFNPSLVSFNEKFNKKDVKHQIFVVTKTKSGWVNGYHSGAGGVEHLSTLTF